MRRYDSWHVKVEALNAAAERRGWRIQVIDQPASSRPAPASRLANGARSSERQSARDATIARNESLWPSPKQRTFINKKGKQPMKAYLTD